MDEDLKIVISTELEADEVRSVQRISKQLPAISEGLDKKGRVGISVEADEAKSSDAIAKQLKAIGDLVNTKGTIKVGVEIDEAKVRSQSHQIARDVLSATKSQSVPISIAIDETPLERLKRHIHDLGIEGRAMNGHILDEPEIAKMDAEIENVISEITSGLTRIDNVSHRVMEDIGDGTKQIMSIAVSGLNESNEIVGVQRQIAIGIDSIGQAGLDVGRQYTAITDNIKQQRQEQERLNKQTEEREAYLIRQKQVLEGIRNVWEGRTAAVGVSDDEHLKDLEDNYRVILSLMEVLENESGQLGKKQRAGIEAALSAMKNLVVEYRNAEKAATALRTRSVDTSRDVDTAGLIKFERDLKTSGIMTQEFQTQINALKVELNSVADGDGIQAFLDKFEILKARVQAFKADVGLADKVADVNAKLETTRTTVETIQHRAAALSNPTENLRVNVSELAGLLNAVDRANTDSERIRAFNELQKKIRDCRTELTALNQDQNLGIRDVRFTAGLEKAKADLATIARTWSAFKSDPGLNRQFKQLRENLRDINNQPGLTKWTAQFNAFKSEIKAAGLNVQSLGDTLKNNLGKVMQWVSATTMLFRAFRLLNEAVSTVVELDTALVDLRKTTTMTGGDLASFYREANEAAKELGVSTKQIIQSAADWSRLGFGSKEDATRMAKLAAQFAAISPSMNIDESTTGLVSVMKAFGVEVEDVLDGIMSKINAVGNTAATNNKEIVAGLQNSASALAAAGSTIDESIALFTAAQEILQDESKASTAIRSIAMRVRGYNEETEELDENLIDINGDVINLTKTANNMNGVSLFTDTSQTEYKSLGQYLHDIADIWDELDAKAKQSLSEKLFGKLRANAGQAILTNIKAYDKALETMANSAGSANAEMTIIQDSLEYKLNALRETWVGVAQDIANRGDVSAVISSLQSLSDVVTGLTSAFGLFGTIGIGSFVVALYKIIKSGNAASESISNVVSHFNRIGHSFENNVQSVGQYATKLQDLNGVQRAVAMNALGLNSNQQNQINAFINATSACDGLTLAEILGADATKKQKQQTDRLTQSQLLQLAASGQMNNKLRDAILKKGADAAATGAQKKAQDALNLSVREYLAMQWQTAAGKIAIVTGALSAAISIGTFAYNAWKRYHEEIISSANEAAQSYTEEAKSIKDYRLQVLELKKALDSGNLSEQEAYEKRKQLLDIKDSVVEAFGYEAQAIDVLGDSADETNRKFGNLTKTLAAKGLLTEKKGIDNATEQIEKNRSWDFSFGMSDSWNDLDDTIKNRITDIVAQYDDAELVVRNLGRGYSGVAIEVSNNARDAEQTILGLSNALNDLEKELKSDGIQIPTVLQSVFESTKSTFGYALEEIQNIEEKYGRIYDTATIQRIVSDDTYSAINQQIEDVKEQYKDAVANGNEEAAVEAITSLSNIDLSGVTNAAVKRFFEDFIKSVEVESKKTVARVRVKAEIEGDDKQSGLLSGLSQLSGGIGTVKLSDIRAAELSARANVGSRNSTNAENGYDRLQEEAKNYGIEVEDLIDILIEQGIVFDDMREKAQKVADTVAPLTDVISEFAETEDGINKLSAALKEFVDDGTVSIKTLDGIGKEMGGLDSFEEFYATMLNGNATMEEAQAITNKLGGEYIDSSKALRKLTDGYSDEVVAALKRLGVINAEEVVESRLAQERVNARVDALGLADAEWKIAEAELQAAGASQAEIDALKLLRLKKLDEMVSSENFIKTHGAVSEAMLQAAAAAGVEAEAIAKLNEIKTLEKLIEIETDPFGLKSMRQSVAILKNQVRGEIEKAIADVRVRTDVPISTSVSGSGGSSSKTSKNTDRYFSEIDRFREYIKAVNDAQEEAEQLNGILGRVGDLERQADLHEQLAGQYDIECTALHALNEERRKAIREGVDILNGAGLNAEYDPQANDLYIRDLERINELVYKDIPYGMRKFEYDSNGRLNFLGGNYDNQTDALNNYKKQLEGLVSTISGWNDDAKSDSEQWLKEFDEAFKSRIESYEKRVKALDNRITLNENWQENAIVQRDYSGIREYTDNVIDAYRQMQEQVAAEAAYYRSQGYSDTSDEVSRLSDLWWDYQGEIESATKNAWDAVVSNANSALDDIQNVYSALTKAAQEYSEYGGYISVDTYQEVLALGPKYLSMLRDENGTLKINKDRVIDVVKARTEELGLEQAIAYVEELRASKDDPQKLADLTRAIRQETTARWDLVKAELASLNLNEQDYQAALHNIEAIEALTVGAVGSINKSLSGTSELMDYVMDMVKQEIEEQIDAINDMITSYKEIVDLEKKRLQNAKAENDYQKDMASRMKDMAKLQARIDALSLAANSGDRKAQAERAELLEQMSELQNQVADKQAEHTLDKQTEMLDLMSEEYEGEKKKEVEKLEDSIASKERIYQMALKRIREGYSTLRDDLISWNERVGSSLEYEISNAWESATDAARSYYNYVNGQTLSQAIDDYYRGSASPSSGDTSFGNDGAVAKVASSPRLVGNSVNVVNAVANESDIRHWVSVMQENSRDWLGASKVERERLEKENQTITDKYLPDLGLTGLHRGADGVWYLKDGRKLYDVYGGYHEGGYVGGKGEQLGLLKSGEFVLTETMIANLVEYFDRLKKLGQGIAMLPATMKNLFVGDGFKSCSNTNISNITNTNNRPVEIRMGNVIINGADGDTVKQHQKISRDQVNEIAKMVGLKQ